MKVGILGGGFTGLTLAYELLKKGYQISLFEAQPYWGGLVASFEPLPGVFVERFYHHLFTNDSEILSFLTELGLSGELRVLDGKTSHYYKEKIYSLDSPSSVLRFAPLNVLDRLRFGFVTLFLKLWPWGELWHGERAYTWVQKWYGKRVSVVVWEPLLKGKFAGYYSEISMTWLWARIKKRTPKLVYPMGGFQTIINRLVGLLKVGGAKLKLESPIESLRLDKNGKWVVGREGADEIFDKIVLTTSLRSIPKFLPNLKTEYLENIDSIKYINALVVLLVLRRKLTPHYWINIADTGFPFLVIGEQSNLFGLNYYQGRSLVYLGNYLPDGQAQLSLSAEELLDLYEPYLKKLNPDFDRSWVEKVYKFVGPFAQPIVDTKYRERIPGFEIQGYPNLYLATMAQVYPWDRGTNYAVKLAQDLAKKYF